MTINDINAQTAAIKQYAAKLSKIKESDWGAGQYLYELLKNHKLKQFVGESTKVLMLENFDSMCLHRAVCVTINLKSFSK